MSQAGPSASLCRGIRLDASTGFDPKALRAALGSFATGVTIVTTRGLAGEDVGLTANSFSSVSLDPPMVLWSLAESSTSIEAFRAAKHFAVHVLAGDQEELSARFAGKGGDKFAGIELERGPGDIPLLRDCTARFACRTAFQYEGGDHTIFVGEIGGFAHSKRPPLVFHGGRYGMLFEKEPPQPVRAEGVEDRLSPDDLLYHVARTYHLMRQDALAERRRRGWTEEENAALNILGREGILPVHRLHELGQRRGWRITPELVAGLVSRGLLGTDGPIGPESDVRLTAAGRDAIIETVAMLKASEAKVLGGMDASEVQLLKRLLRRIPDE